MSRSGYDDDYGCDDPLLIGRWRAQVNSAIRGARGQGFLRDLAVAMDAMQDKSLIAGELVNEHGGCCAIGVVCKARGLDVSAIDYDDTSAVGAAVGIAHQMAAEIEYENDENALWSLRCEETPSDRWRRMRRWVDAKLNIDAKLNSKAAAKC